MAQGGGGSARTERPWRLRRPHPASGSLAYALGVPGVVAALLCNRGLTDPEAARRWLDAPEADLTDAGTLPGATEAGAVIARSLLEGRRPCVYGDYDIDGTTGASILRRTIRSLAGVDPTVYLPHRLEEGYGLNPAAVERIAAAGHGLLVTVDCGIASPDEVALARRRGMRVVVTDHHRPKDVLPDADAIAHPDLPGPNRKGPSDNLCGSAAAWKTACEVMRSYRKRTKTGSGVAADRLTEGDLLLLRECMAPAATGTVGDVVPLVGENRVIVRHGLEVFTRTTHPGFVALREASDIDGPVGAEDVGFRIGPRINAAGRLGFAGEVVTLLGDDWPTGAVGVDGAAGVRSPGDIARHMDYANTERRRIERKILAEATAQAEIQVAAGDAALVVGSADWHPGVIGIVASRLVERFQRPALIVSFGTRSGIGYGSGRSTPRLALNEALHGCGSWLKAYGGHAMAAGFKVERENFEAFSRDFRDRTAGTFGGVPPPEPLDMEAELLPGDVTVALVESLVGLEPHGAANPRPLFLMRRVRATQVREIGKDKTHLSFGVFAAGSPSVRCIAFGAADRKERLAAGPVDLACVPTVNVYMGRKSPQLEVKDFREARA